MSTVETRLAVLGSPIEHSRSPELHSAAYRALGLDWSYGRFEVDGSRLGRFLDERGPGWRGLSLTMPLKSAVIPRCATVSETARLAGAVNTLVFDGPSADAAGHGHNTDVEGFRAALREVGTEPRRVDLLGAGNTGASAVVAVAGLGARRLRILARRPERARPLEELAGQLGLEVEVVHLDAFVPDEDVDLVVDTIPDGRSVHARYPLTLRQRATLFEAVYDPWPPAMAASWLDAGGTVVTGLDLLVHQAVGQVRLFVRPEDHAATVTDATLLARMREALEAHPGH